MKEYIEPEVEVIEYSLADVIAASQANYGDDTGGGSGGNTGGAGGEGDIPIGGGNGDNDF